MRTAFDFSPLYRPTIGFDRVFNLLEDAPRTFDDWPPCDIERHGENAYRVTIAVAGSSEDELDISHEPNLLVVTGQRGEPGGVEYKPRRVAIAREDDTPKAGQVEKPKPAA